MERIPGDLAAPTQRIIKCFNLASPISTVAMPSAAPSPPSVCLPFPATATALDSLGANSLQWTAHCVCGLNTWSDSPPAQAARPSRHRLSRYTILDRLVTQLPQLSITSQFSCLEVFYTYSMTYVSHMALVVRLHVLPVIACNFLRLLGFFPLHI